MLAVMSEDDRNSHFFQERVLIESIRNSPGKLIVIQVPVVEESLKFASQIREHERGKRWIFSSFHE